MATNATILNIKHCQKCKLEKPLSEMTKCNEYSYRCRECNTKMCRDFRKTEAGKAAIKRATSRYELKNPDRRKAWNKAKYIPTKPCEICGQANTHRHHPDIKKPMSVQFLCPLHHKAAHAV